jgi:hypothetical protein
MANAVYPKYKEALLKDTAGFDLSSAGVDVRVLLVDLADYTYSAAHDMLDDVPSGARVAASTALASKTVSTAGVFDAADKTFTAVTGDQSEALIIYQHTGTESTSQLIAFLDTGITGIPVTPNGGDIAITWNASGIFAL